MKKPRKIKLGDRIQSRSTFKWFKVCRVSDQHVYGFDDNPNSTQRTFSHGEFLTEAEVRDLWRTPELLAAYLVEKYKLERDVASSNLNKVCDLNFDETEDGLAQEWDKNSWCNPPYSDILPWAEKALESDVTTVLLLPMRTASPWFRALTGERRVAWYAFKGRVAFTPPPGVKNSSPRHDSGLFVVHKKGISTNGFSGILLPKTGVQL